MSALELALVVDVAAATRLSSPSEQVEIGDDDEVIAEPEEVL